MGFDSVSISTRTGLGSIYNQWKYAVNNKKTTDNFKTYLLSSQEHLNQLEGLFTDYGHVDGSYGDTFVRESIVELKDGRLLCMDPTEAQAYILDLNEVNSTSQKYNLTVIKPEDTSLSFAEQMTNLINKISTQLGADGVTTTKDGTKIDSTLLTGLLSGDAKTQYYDEMGIVDTSETDNIYTSGALKLVAAKGITDITTDDDQRDYYREAFEAQGVTFEPDGTTFTSGSTAFISNLNNTINNLSKYINKGTTATDQDKLNALQIVRKMSTLEYELLEKMNPGFTQAFNTFIGDFQSRTYLDRNGNQTGNDTTISYQTVMQEKLQGMGDWTTYLNAEDRAIVDSYLNKYVGSNGKIYTKQNDGSYVDSNGCSSNDKSITFTEITKDNFNTCIDKILSNEGNNLDSSIISYAKKACEVASSSTAYNAMYDAISQTVTLGVSDATIEAYKDDINNATTPDGVLLAFLDASNTKDGAEITARILADSEMVDKLKTACAEKGTLNIIDRRTGKTKTGPLYNSSGEIVEKAEYNVENILNHLENIKKSYYRTKSDSTSSVNSSKASNAVGDAFYVAENGDSSDNIKSNSESIKNTNTAATMTATGTGTIGTAAAVIAGTVGAKSEAGFLATSSGWALKGAAKGSFHIFTKTATTAASWGAVGTTLLGTGLGAAGGLWVGNKLVESNPEKYTNADGTYNQGKATWVKTLSSISGAAFGFAATSFWGWPLTGVVGGIVGAVCGIVTAIVHYNA